MKHKILFLMQFPPPVHGSSLLCEFVSQSIRLKETYSCEFIDISSELSLSSIGRFQTIKLTRSLIKVITVCWTYLRRRSDLVYFVLTPTGFAFYRDAAIVLLVKMLGGKFVLQLHCKGLENATQTNLRRWFYALVFKGCDVIQSDELLHDDIRNCFDFSRKAYFVANGCPDSGPSPKSSSHSRPLEILYLSNFIPSKGADTLIKAINDLPPEYAGQLNATLIGGITDQDYFEELKVLAQSRYPENIVVIGPLYGKAKDQIFARADIFVLPTSYPNECYPVSILEAMSHNAAVLSTYEGAISAMIQVGKNGAQFEANDSAELSRLLKIYCDDRNLLLEHQRFARDCYEATFTVTHFQERTMDVLDDIFTRRSIEKND